MSDDGARNRRKHVVRSKVVHLRVLKNDVAREAEVSRIYDLVEGEKRPEVRRDCIDGHRPCLWVSCKHNLFLDVRPNGSVQFNFPDLEPEEMGASCVLDLIEERGNLTLEEVGEVMNLTRERVRQLEEKVHEKITLATQLELVVTGKLSGLAELVQDERRKPVEGDREIVGVPEPEDEEDEEAAAS